MKSEYSGGNNQTIYPDDEEKHDSKQSDFCCDIHLLEMIVFYVCNDMQFLFSRSMMIVY
jgi:hypothetical protein